MLKTIKLWFKDKMKFSWTQIPLLFIFSLATVIFFVSFSNSKTAFCESVARQITETAKKSDSRQLTVNFYPTNIVKEVDQKYLSRMISDTNSFNETHYSSYKNNSHKLRIIANGEGRRDYWFPDFQSNHINPTFILENSFSHAWEEKYLYESLNLNLVNEKNNYGSDNNRHFFINERDALYLIANNPNFAGLTLGEVAGKSIPMHYYDYNGAEQIENWTISNIIFANQLDDQLYMSLYKSSYIICSSYLPCYAYNISSAFDFSIGEIDNIHFLNDLSIRYSSHKMVVDSRSYKTPNFSLYDEIVNNFYRYSNYKIDNKYITYAVVVAVVIISIIAFIWCYSLRVPTFSTNVMYTIIFAIIYTIFMLFSAYSPFGTLDMSFNTISIICGVFYFIMSTLSVVLADAFLGSKKRKINNE